MRTYLYYPGCSLTGTAKEYDLSVRALAERLSMALVEIDDWTCCGATAAQAVDTGLAHLAAAAGLPGLALYGPTDPVLTGVQGVRAESRAADFPCAPCVQERCTYRGELGKGVSPPCFSTLKPEFVWRELKRLSP